MDENLFNIFSQWFGHTGVEVESKNKFFDDKAAVDAHVNAGKVYDYYKRHLIVTRSMIKVQSLFPLFT